MKNIKVGLLPLYIKLYDDVNVDRSVLEKFYSTVAKRIEEQGFSVITNDVCRVKTEFKDAISKFESQGAQAIITLHLAYSPSLESIDALSNTKLPIVVLDTTEAPSYSKKYSVDPLMLNHGIHGVMDMCNLLKQRGKKYVVVAGHIDSSDVIKRACDCVKGAIAGKSISGSKVGLIGTSFDGMGDFLISDKDAKKKFGVNIIHFNDSYVKDVYDSISSKEIEKEKNYYADNFITEGKENSDSCKKSIKGSLALRKIIKENNLDAFSVNFLDVSSANLGSMPFVECCLEMQNGIGYAGEGDALTASMVGGILKTFDKASFIEIFCPDWKNDMLFISHMGEMNYALAKDKPVLEVAPFRYTDAGDCVKGLACYKGGKAVFCNLFKDSDGDYKLLLSNIEMLEVDTHDFDDCIRGWFKPSVSLPSFLEKLSDFGGIHHSFVVYDVDIKALKFFAENAGVKYIEL